MPPASIFEPGLCSLDHHSSWYSEITLSLAY
jgi:hypothetical protein